MNRSFFARMASSPFLVAAQATLVCAVFGAIGCSKEPAAAAVAEFDAFHDMDDAPPAVRAMAAAVVRVGTIGEYGTGAFISGDGQLLTNNHILGADICAIKGCYASLTFGHERHKPPRAAMDVFVVPLHVDVGLDMAVVQVYSSGSSAGVGAKLVTPDFVTIESHDAASLVGTKVFVVGHPEGRLKKWSSGDVDDTEGSWIQSSAFTLPGNSGSPIVNEAGKLVGILHRGPSGEDLVTRSGLDVYSIGTASSALLNAMGDPLPSVMRDVTLAAASADDVVAHQSVYLNAHVSSVPLPAAAGAPAAPGAPPAPQPILSMLGDACDRGLARNDFASPDDLDTFQEPCVDAMQWIECESDAEAAFGVCPTGDDNKAWSARFSKAADRYYALHGALWLSGLSFGQASLQSSKGEGMVAAQQSLGQALAAAQPPMDFILTNYLAAFGIADYQGTKVVEYTQNYAKVTHYELSILRIAYTALWLANQGLMSGNDAIALLTKLMNDGKADLAAKLYIEDVLYNSKRLD